MLYIHLRNMPPAPQWNCSLPVTFISESQRCSPSVEITAGIYLINLVSLSVRFLNLDCCAFIFCNSQVITLGISEFSSFSFFSQHPHVGTSFNTQFNKATFLTAKFPTLAGVLSPVRCGRQFVVGLVLMLILKERSEPIILQLPCTLLICAAFNWVTGSKVHYVAG